GSSAPSTFAFGLVGAVAAQPVVSVSVDHFAVALQDRAAFVAIGPRLAVIVLAAVEDLHDDGHPLAFGHAVAVNVDERVGLADPHQDGEAEHVQHVAVAQVAAAALAGGPDANLPAGDDDHIGLGFAHGSGRPSVHLRCLPSLGEIAGLFIWHNQS